MDNFSLVPVDYQPKFENVSLVPVDYNPFPEDKPFAKPAGATGADSAGAIPVSADSTAYDGSRPIQRTDT
jgi:hypothetical protein